MRCIDKLNTTALDILAHICEQMYDKDFTRLNNEMNEVSQITQRYIFDVTDNDITPIIASGWETDPAESDEDIVPPTPVPETPSPKRRRITSDRCLHAPTLNCACRDILPHADICPGCMVHDYFCTNNVVDLSNL